jgi:hypothetical protein
VISSPPTRARAARAARRPTAAPAENGAHAPFNVLPPEWRAFVGRWLEASGCAVRSAARGDWEVELSSALQRRWRRQRVRLVFDPQRPTLPRGAWFTAPGSSAGRRILDAAVEQPAFTRRTALVRVPGAPENGLASVCRVRALTWGAPRLGPVRYERRVAFHAVVTRWGGLPTQEPWVVLLGPAGEFLEWTQGSELPETRSREGLYQINDDLSPDHRADLVRRSRLELERLLSEREEDWERTVARLRDDELARLGSFFSSRIEEEEERLRRRTGNGDESEIEYGDATSLKLEWERRAAEVRQRWALRTEIRLWGIEEWSWPVTEVEQELKAGAVHVKLTARVDVARGRPDLPRCPGCGTPAEMLVRSHGSVGCARCS